MDKIEEVKNYLDDNFRMICSDSVVCVDSKGKRYGVNALAIELTLQLGKKHPTFYPSIIQAWQDKHKATLCAILYWYLGHKCESKINKKNWKLEIIDNAGQAVCTNDLVAMFRGIYTATFIKSFVDNYKLDVINNMF